jgi:hypothetical protein
MAKSGGVGEGGVWEESGRRQILSGRDIWGPAVTGVQISPFTY